MLRARRGAEVQVRVNGTLQYIYRDLFAVCMVSALALLDSDILIELHNLHGLTKNRDATVIGAQSKLEHASRLRKVLVEVVSTFSQGGGNNILELR